MTAPYLPGIVRTSAYYLVALAFGQFAVHLAAADCDRNGREDAEEIAAGDAEDCNRNGVPDTCDLESRLEFEAAWSFPLSGGIDLDDDGASDLVFVESRSVTVLSRTADGLILEAWPASEIADFNGDSRADLAFVCGGVCVLFNDGTDRFTSGQVYNLNARGVVSADFDRDGDRDVAVVTGIGLSPFGITMLLNDGGGMFSPREQVDFELPGASGLVADDVDGDGDADLLLVPTHNQPWIHLLRNRGDAVLDADVTVPMGVSIADVRSADLDGDGDVDLIGIPRGDRNQHLVLVSNDGTGQFSEPIMVPVDAPAESVAIDDLDADGDIDIAVKIFSDRWPRVSRLQVLINDGGGKFLPRAGLPFTGAEIAAADLEGDGDVDILASVPDGIVILRNRGDAAFVHAPAYPVERRPEAVVLGDLDGDGDIDAATAGHRTAVDGRGSVSILSNTGDGTFEATTVETGGETGDLAAGDVDGDGDIDLALSLLDAREPFFVVLTNDGGGVFAESSRLSLQDDTRAITTADLDGDGRADVVVGPSRQDLFVFTAEENGFTETRVSLGQSCCISAADIEATDLDGDGDLDLIIANIGRENVLIVENLGSLQFAIRGTHDVEIPTSVTAADVDRDGDNDLVISSRPRAVGHGVLIFANRGGGEFTREVELEQGVSFVDADVTDLDDDGRADIVARSFSSIVYLMRGPGGDYVVADRRVWAGNDVRRLAVGDLDDDGDPDIAAADFATGSLFVVENRLSPSRSGDSNRNGVPDECEFHRGDSDGNGRLNISDPVSLLRYLFQGAAVPRCLESADADNDGRVSLTDSIYLLAFLFLQGPPPLPPGPPGHPCGSDPVEPRPQAFLGCESYPPCP